MVQLCAGEIDDQPALCCNFHCPKNVDERCMVIGDVNKTCVMFITAILYTNKVVRIHVKSKIKMLGRYNYTA
jgi:uncharacterized DUF497 family protein